MDNQPKYSHQQLVDASADTFASNPDVSMLLATTHDGQYYRPEFRSYAESEAAKHNSQVVEINQLVGGEQPGGEVDMISLPVAEYNKLVAMASATVEQAMALIAEQTAVTSKGEQSAASAEQTAAPKPAAPAEQKAAPKPAAPKKAAAPKKPAAPKKEKAPKADTPTEQNA